MDGWFIVWLEGDFGGWVEYIACFVGVLHHALIRWLDGRLLVKFIDEWV